MDSTTESPRYIPCDALQSTSLVSSHDSPNDSPNDSDSEESGNEHEDGNYPVSSDMFPHGADIPILHQEIFTTSPDVKGKEKMNEFVVNHKVDFAIDHPGRRNGKPWTAPEERIVLDNVSRGWSHEDTANKIGRSETAVLTRCMQIAMRIKKEEGLEDEEIKRMTGLSNELYDEAIDKFEKNYPRCPPEQIKKAAPKGKRGKKEITLEEVHELLVRLGEKVEEIQVTLARMESER